MVTIFRCWITHIFKEETIDRIDSILKKNTNCQVILYSPTRSTTYTRYAGYKYLQDYISISGGVNCSSPLSINSNTWGELMNSSFEMLAETIASSNPIGFVVVT